MTTLKELRMSRGIQQKAVAKELGVARQTYAEYEQSPWKMRYSQVLKVCEFLHCSMKDVSDFLFPDEC